MSEKPFKPKKIVPFVELGAKTKVKKLCLAHEALKGVDQLYAIKQELCNRYGPLSGLHLPNMPMALDMMAEYVLQGGIALLHRQGTIKRFKVFQPYTGECVFEFAIDTFTP